ncbi:hypothetical protein GC207_15680 [bacterium]|nr:hypothetical protein [bacterium]
MNISSVGIFSVYAAASATAPEKPADQFKRFLEEPPPIKMCIYDQEVPEPDGKSTYLQNLFRWQTNGLLFAQSYTNLETTGAATNLLDYPDLIGYYDRNYARKQGGLVTEWIDKGSAVESHNSLKAASALVLRVFVADILNMGCHLVPVGSIQWTGDSFQVTNDYKGTFVQGTLFRDEQGRAESLSVESRLVGKPKDKDEIWFYEYHYERPLSLAYLPSRIVSSKSINGTNVVVSIFNIYTLEAAESPLSEDFFRIPNFVLTNNLVAHVTVSNKFLVYDQDGQNFMIADSFAADKARLITKKIYYLIAVLLFSPLVFFWAYQKVKKKK